MCLFCCFYKQFVYIFAVLLRNNDMTGEVKKKRRTYNKEILKRLVEKLGYTERYCTMCLSGDLKSEMADIIKKEYNTMEKAVIDLLKTM